MDSPARRGPAGDEGHPPLSGRGVAYWTDGEGDDRIYTVTIGYQLVGLDARTGRRLSDFGVDGIVDLKRDNDQPIDPLTGEIGWNSAPVVARDVVIVGASHRSGGSPPSRDNVKGYIRGYDARTGERRRGAVYLPAAQTGSPMTYMLDGRQYVVVAVGGGTYHGELIAFALP